MHEESVIGLNILSTRGRLDVIDMELLLTGMEYGNLPDAYVIFVCESANRVLKITISYASML